MGRSIESSGALETQFAPSVRIRFLRKFLEKTTTHHHNDGIIIPVNPALVSMCEDVLASDLLPCVTQIKLNPSTTIKKTGLFNKYMPKPANWKHFTVDVIDIELYAKKLLEVAYPNKIWEDILLAGRTYSLITERKQRIQHMIRNTFIPIRR